MKKYLAILLAMLLLLSACAPSEQPIDTDGSTTESVEGTTTTTTTEEGEITGCDVDDPSSSCSGDSTTQQTGEGTTSVTGNRPGSSTQQTGTTKKPGGSTQSTGTTKKPGGSTQKTSQSGTKKTTSTTKKTTTTKLKVSLEAGDMQRLQTILETENKWLSKMQLDNGALPMTAAKSGTVKVSPYFSDFAALSMLNQPELYAGTVKKYMEWHFNHLNTARTDYNGVDGTIYDYHLNVSNGKVTAEYYIDGTPSYDSTDSYAATFLMVLQKYVEKTGDTNYIVGRYKDIERIVSAMFATMVKGLTLAKPDYRIKYLMDNCEVYEGMVAAEKLYTNVLVPASSKAKTTRDKLKNGAATIKAHIEDEMWNMIGGYYEPALGVNGEVAYSFSWSNFYPSATAQLFPLLHGLIDPSSSRAKSLYQSFCNNYDWQNFRIPDTFYWGSNVWAAAKMGDADRVMAYMTKYEKVMRHHAYPLYNADAAKVAMAAYELIQLAK